MGIEKGRIAVYDKDEKLLDSVVYYTSKRMREKLDEFMKEYSGQEGNYIQVRPYTDEPKRKVKPKLTRIDIPFIQPVKKLQNGQEFVRPPAEYNRIPTYKYDD